MGCILNECVMLCASECDCMRNDVSYISQLPQDFGLDCDKFRHVIYGADCPEGFLQLAYQCCKVCIL